MLILTASYTLADRIALFDLRSGFQSRTCCCSKVRVFSRYFLVSVQSFLGTFFDLLPSSLILRDLESRVSCSRVDLVRDFIQIITNCLRVSDILFAMEKISENYTQDEPQSFGEKESHHEQLRPISKETPLYFGLRINGNYYISYKKTQLKVHIIFSAVLIAFNIFLISLLSNFEELNETFLKVLKLSLVLQSVLMVILCFLDPGTIFQDEEDNNHEDRAYCMTCQLYRLRSSKHCIWCNKCVQKYDHHCGVFGKCIGKRNLVPFWLFIAISALEGPTLIILFGLQILKSA